MAQDTIHTKPHLPESLANLLVFRWLPNITHLPQRISLGLWASHFNYLLLHFRFSVNQYPCFPLSVLSQRDNYFSLSKIIIYLLSQCLYPYIPWKCPSIMLPLHPQSVTLHCVFPSVYIFIYSLSSNKSLLWSCLYSKFPFHLFPLVGNFWK